MKMKNKKKNKRSNRDDSFGDELLIRFCEYLSDTPFWGKVVIFFSFIGYIFGLTSTGTKSLFVNNPGTTLFSFNVWRIFSGFWFDEYFLSLVVSLALFKAFLCQDEKKIGTIKFLLNFYGKSAILSLLFDVIIGIPSLLITYLRQFNSNGHWMFLILEISLIAFHKPEEYTTLCCKTVKIKNKLFPAIICLLYMYFNSSFFPIEVILGFCAALIYKFSLEKRYNINKVSFEFVERIENSFFFAIFRDLDDFYKIRKVVITYPISDIENGSSKDIIDDICIQKIDIKGDKNLSKPENLEIIEENTKLWVNSEKSCEKEIKAKDNNDADKLKQSYNVVEKSELFNENKGFLNKNDAVDDMLDTDI